MRKTALMTVMFVASLPLPALASAQDSVDVAFRYVNSGISQAYLPGEFNGWSSIAWPMNNAGGGVWTYTARLQVNPPSTAIPGTWQYKFYYSGASPWPNDPLNHHVNNGDVNKNTFIIARDPTFYQVLPNQRYPYPTVSTSTPTVTAYIYPKLGTSLDVSTISLNVDGTTYTGLGSSYNYGSQQLTYTLPTPLANGSHTMIIKAGTLAGGSNADTVTFVMQAGYVQITTQGGYATRNQYRLIRGSVQDTTKHVMKLVRNGADTTVVPVSAGLYSVTDTLVEGLNTFQALADSAGSVAASSPVSFTYIVNHAPYGKVSVTPSGNSVILNAGGSTDPFALPLSYQWFDDPAYPLGLNGTTGVSASVGKPLNPGEYYFGLIVTNTGGDADTSRGYFVVNAGGSIDTATIARNPIWAQQARVYFLFPKAASSAGTINAAAQRLHNIRDMGFSVIWMMPVMKNAFPIDNHYGPGYNIVDFYNVAPEYGTNQDFKNFVDSAHALGMKVILDVTPNHTSRFHPWSQDAHTYLQDSRYWTWYEHQMITANTNGLGDCLDGNSFNYYCGFSDQLLNYNWRDVDARTEMINVYKYWIQQFGIDGYRFDVYWGPHRRYGEAYMGIPVRAALKHIKPDILLLGEDDGTGTGTEAIYADYVSGGGLDAAYDFKLYFNQIRNFGFSSPAIDNLNSDILNGGFYPGKDALYMRFMESQDEDRIYYAVPNPPATSTYYYPSPTVAFMKTMPMASVVFTIPGFPMLWNGQEVGWGYGISGTKEDRNRSVINWDFQGKGILSPHYQKLATIRGQFPAFTQHRQDTNGDGHVDANDLPDFVRIGTNNGLMYAFTRPWQDQNGMTVVNFSDVPQTAQLNLALLNGLKFTGGIQPGTLYYLNNLTTNSHQQIAGANLDSVFITLPAYGTGIYTVSTTADSVIIANPILAVKSEQQRPVEFALEQNYPNPFNPSTTIRFQIPQPGSVSLKIYDVLGREVAGLIDRPMGAGAYSIVWNGMNARGLQVGSGVYFYRLVLNSNSSQNNILVRKMLLLK